MFESIQRGDMFDRSIFTRKALKELRERAAQKDVTACYYLGLYYLNFVKSGRSKARDFFKETLRIARKINNTDIEADARRKLLSMDLVSFYKRYKVPFEKCRAVPDTTYNEMKAIAAIYDKTQNFIGKTADSRACLPVGRDFRRINTESNTCDKK